MLSNRTRLSLVQLLTQQDEKAMAVLLAKYGADMQFRGSYFSEGMRQAVEEPPAEQVLALAAEVVATRNSLHHPVSPKTRFDSGMPTSSAACCSTAMRRLRAAYAVRTRASPRRRRWRMT